MNSQAKQKAETVLSCKRGKMYRASYTSVPLTALSTKAVVLKLAVYQNHLGNLLKDCWPLP